MVLIVWWSRGTQLFEQYPWQGRVMVEWSVDTLLIINSLLLKHSNLSCPRMFPQPLTRCWSTSQMVGSVTLLNTAKRGDFIISHTMINRLSYRCKRNPSKCSTGKDPVLEQNDGIWSANITENPFAEYFKIVIHYCSSDNFAGMIF